MTPVFILLYKSSTTPVFPLALWIYGRITDSSST